MDDKFLSGAIPGDKGNKRKESALTPRNGAMKVEEERKQSTFGQAV